MIILKTYPDSQHMFKAKCLPTPICTDYLTKIAIPFKEAKFLIPVPDDTETPTNISQANSSRQTP